MSKHPGPSRSLTVGATALIGTWWLTRIAPAASRPTSTHPGSIVSWWEAVGTPAAAMSLIRVAGIAAGTYIAVVASIAVVLGLTGILGRSVRAVSLWNFVSTDGMRRLLAVGTVAIWASGPLMASASVDPPPPIVLIDLGPASANAPLTLETIIADTQETPPIAIEVSDTTGRDTERTWTVARGDDLWRIAEQVLERDGATQPSAGDTAEYWKRLIAENYSTVGANPDLIFPGQLLKLPAR